MGWFSSDESINVNNASGVGDDGDTNAIIILLLIILLIKIIEFALFCVRGFKKTVLEGQLRTNA